MVVIKKMTFIAVQRPLQSKEDILLQRKQEKEARKLKAQSLKLKKNSLRVTERGSTEQGSTEQGSTEQPECCIPFTVPSGEDTQPSITPIDDPRYRIPEVSTGVPELMQVVPTGVPELMQRLPSVLVNGMPPPPVPALTQPPKRVGPNAGPYRLLFGMPPPQAAPTRGVLLQAEEKAPEVPEQQLAPRTSGPPLPLAQQLARQAKEHHRQQRLAARAAQEAIQNNPKPRGGVSKRERKQQSHEQSVQRQELIRNIRNTVLLQKQLGTAVPANVDVNAVLHQQRLAHYELVKASKKTDIAKHNAQLKEMRVVKQLSIEQTRALRASMKPVKQQPESTEVSREQRLQKLAEFKNNRDAASQNAAAVTPSRLIRINNPLSMHAEVLLGIK